MNNQFRNTLNTAPGTLVQREIIIGGYLEDSMLTVWENEHGHWIATVEFYQYPNSVLVSSDILGRIEQYERFHFAEDRDDTWEEMTTLNTAGITYREYVEAMRARLQEQFGYTITIE